MRYGIYRAMGIRRAKNGRKEQSKAMEYGSRKASSNVPKPRNIYIRAGPRIRLPFSGKIFHSVQHVHLLGDYPATFELEMWRCFSRIIATGACS